MLIVSVFVFFVYFINIIFLIIGNTEIGNGYGVPGGGAYNGGTGTNLSAASKIFLFSLNSVWDIYFSFSFSFSFFSLSYFIVVTICHDT